MANKTKPVQTVKTLTVDDLLALLAAGKKNEVSKRSIFADHVKMLPNNTVIGTGFCLKVLEAVGRGPKSGKRHNPEALHILEKLEDDGLLVECPRADGQARHWKVVGGTSVKPKKRESAKGKTDEKSAGSQEPGDSVGERTSDNVGDAATGGETKLGTETRGELRTE